MREQRELVPTAHAFDRQESGGAPPQSLPPCRLWVRIGIFAAPIDDVRALMQGDPALESDVLDFEVHPIRGFPGDRLAG